jgi:catechol 2,3-dioxygenase-like lactoylglutathione lyase family enzyme
MKLLSLILALGSICAFGAEPQRPKITGIANIAVRVNNLESVRNFYGHVLGFQEAFTLQPGLICFKVNDRQHVEIAPELKDAAEDRLIHIAFETSGARKLGSYLAVKGVRAPAKAAKDSGGNRSFTAKDPNGHMVEFVQYMPKSIHTRNSGKFPADTRSSDHILHAGIHVADRAKTGAFYRDIPGFRLMWEGGPAANPHAWISYLVLDGSDWVEYMMLEAKPNPKQLGGTHRYCLGVKDIQKPYQTVEERGYSEQKPILARDGRWRDTLYDPDFRRTEVMLRKPVQTPLHDPNIESISEK